MLSGGPANAESRSSVSDAFARARALSPQHQHCRGHEGDNPCQSGGLISAQAPAQYPINTCQQNCTFLLTGKRTSMAGFVFSALEKYISSVKLGVAILHFLGNRAAGAKNQLSGRDFGEKSREHLACTLPTPLSLLAALLSSLGAKAEPTSPWPGTAG